MQRTKPVEENAMKNIMTAARGEVIRNIKGITSRGFAIHDTASYYWHQIPGRLRLRTPFIKRNNEGANRIQAFLKPIKGVLATEINTITGSLTILYDPQVIDPESIACKLSSTGYFDKTKAMTNDQYIVSKASSILNFVARFV